MVIGRFAPTPSGDMHLGNAFCYFLAWLSAKSQDGKIILRMEDTDTLRMYAPAMTQTPQELLWLGLTWDIGPECGVTQGEYFQSCRREIYDEYFNQLREKDAVYPCFCSRKDLLSAAAPHAEDGHLIYPGTCRKLDDGVRAELMKTRAPAWRIRLEPETVSFEDLLYGSFTSDILRDCGDFPVRRADGVYCYQFTTGLDDVLMGVNEVVRSNDLLSSTPMQIYLQRLLGFEPPRFIHIPMLFDENGERMAKRNCALSIREISRHYTAEEVIGTLAYLAGQRADIAPCTLEDLLPDFSWERVPKKNITVPRELFSRCFGD